MKPLVDDRRFREELERLEREGANPAPVEIEPSDGTYPPASGPSGVKRLQPVPVMPPEEIERLKAIVRKAGIELINDGACYRAKRQRDFMIWTLETSPLIPENRGGGESHALWEIVARFCIGENRFPIGWKES